MSTLVESLKTRATLIATSVSLVGTIGGAILYFESTYAHADDMKQMVQTQTTLIRNQERSQRQGMLFQLEYYEDKLKQLGNELSRPQRPVADIQRDITDTLQRRDLARKFLTE